jgi:hypothetical protein
VKRTKPGQLTILGRTRATRSKTKPMRASTIENHADRVRIESDLLKGVPVATVARKYGVDRSACQRHIKKLPAHVRAAAMGQWLKPNVDLEQLRQEESEGLLAHLSIQRARLLNAQDTAMEVGDGDLVGRLSGYIHKNIELVGKYLGELAEHHVHSEANLLVHPQYLMLRAALIEALRPFPEAALSVGEALHRVEAKAAGEASQALAGHAR